MITNFLPKNVIQYKVWGRYAMFTDPITRLGGEKFSYQIPTYEALRGITESIYWKPTISWYIDKVRIMNQVRTQTKGMKPLNHDGSVYLSGNGLAKYTFLIDVEYQVQAHFEWNMIHRDLESDRNLEKHSNIARRSLDRGGRFDVFLGTRDCQGYVEPEQFGSGVGKYDDAGELSYGLTFHGFDYPEETGILELRSRFWVPTMVNGIIEFPKPSECKINQFIRKASMKRFRVGTNVLSVDEEEQKVGI